jgi:hypothetical protein
MHYTKNFITEMVSDYITETFLNEQIMTEAVDLLYEKLVVFSGGAKYGQIVFMSGGAGSGKGFASSAFMEGEKFKIRDVDEWKKAFLKLAKLKDMNPELKGLDLTDPDDVFTLHMFVKEKGIKDKTLDLILRDVRTDRLPNIMFDITGKEMKDFEEVIPHLQNAGYQARNIHVAWVLTDFKIAYQANLTRDRVVPADVFLDTHRGASKTMQNLLDRRKMPAGANGRFVVIMNNRTNTILFQTGDTYKGRRVDLKNQKDKEVKNVAGFYYITVKDEGKPFRPEIKWKEELHRQIVSNVPGGQDSIESLRHDALVALGKVADDETKDDEDRQKAARGVGFVKRDKRRDDIRSVFKKKK